MGDVATEQPRARLMMPEGEPNRRLWERRVFNEECKRKNLSVEVKSSPHGGDGLFAIKHFKANSKVVDFLGTVIRGSELKDSRNSVSLIPSVDSLVVNDIELSPKEARAVIERVPGLSFRSPTSLIAIAAEAADFVLDPSGWLNPAQKANDAAYRKHIHKNTYDKQMFAKNNANLWHRITEIEAGVFRITVEIRSTVDIPKGTEICVPYGSSYWFSRNKVKLTCEE